MSISRHLLGGFAAMVMLLVLTAGLVLWALNTVLDSKDRITNDFMQELDAVERLRFRVEQLVSTSRGYLLIGDSTTARRFEAAEASLFERLVALDALADEDDAALREVHDRAVKYLQLVQRAMTSRERGASTLEFVPYLDEVVQPARLALDDSLNRYVERERAAFTASLEEANGTARRASTFAAICSVIAIGLAVLLGAVVLRRQASMLASEQEAIASRQQALAEREEIVRFVSHDLRNPVNAILLGLGLLQRGGNEHPEESVIERVASSARHLKALIEQVLDLARLDQGGLALQLAPTTVSDLLAECHDLFFDQATSAGVALRVDPAPPETVLVDRSRVLQVFSNLIGNALKFTPRGGVVTVSARTLASGGLLFAVADTGPGIAPAALPHVFDRRWQSEPGTRGGLGLGLYIAKMIVEAHHGHILVDSVVGKGSTFSFILPPDVIQPAEPRETVQLH